MHNTRLFLLVLLLNGSFLYGQHGPYPAFGWPKDSLWTVFDSTWLNQDLAAAFAWQPRRSAPLSAVVISPGGLALAPSALLDSALQKGTSWLGDPAGRPLALSGADQLAVITSVEDISDEILTGIPDSISPGARSIKIANRLLKFRSSATPAAEYQSIHAAYQGNRYYRYRWQFQQATLLGQVVRPDGASFALLRLQPADGRAGNDYAYLPLARSLPAETPLFVGGQQTFPRTWLPPEALRRHYGEILPLIEETRQIIASAWNGKSAAPEWLDRLDAADELETPLHPFADPARAVAEAEQREAALLDAAGDNGNAWLFYQQQIRGLQAGYEALTPLLAAEKLCLDVIPARVQFFRLLSFLVKWRESVGAHPELVDRLAGNMQAFLERFYASFDPETDRTVAAALLEIYVNRIRYDLQSPHALAQWLEAGKDARVLAIALYQKSKLTNGRQTLERLAKDPRAFLETLPNDYAYQFMEQWMKEHRERIAPSLQKQQEYLEEEQRKLIQALLRRAPEQAPVEKGGLSVVRLPDRTGSSAAPLSPHYLGLYPAGSPVITIDGKLAGLTYYQGDNPLFFGQTGNRVWEGKDLLEMIKKTAPRSSILGELSVE